MAAVLTRRLAQRSPAGRPARSIAPCRRIPKYDGLDSVGRPSLAAICSATLPGNHGRGRPRHRSREDWTGAAWQSRYDISQEYDRGR